MKKSIKVVLGFLITGVILLWVLLLAVKMTEATLPSETIFPEGNLSESIFESQNNTYTENESLPNVYSFYEVPYKVSVPNVKGATVGTGRMYDYDSNFLIYVGEYNKLTDTTGVPTLSSQLGKAILIDAKEDACTMQNMTADEGYINGFAASYMSNIFYVSNGADKEKEVCLTAYHLSVEENPEYNITIAVVSKTQSTQYLAMSKEILDVVTGTCIYSEDLDAMQKAEKEMEQAEQADEEQSQEEEIKEEVSGVMPTEELLVTIPENYNDLVLYFNYSNTDSVVSARLYTMDKLNFYDFTTNNNGIMIFHVGKVSAGDYVLEVTGDYGSGNVQLTDNEAPLYETQEEQSSTEMEEQGDAAEDAADAAEEETSSSANAGSADEVAGETSSGESGETSIYTDIEE